MYSIEGRPSSRVDKKQDIQPCWIFRDKLMIIYSSSFGEQINYTGTITAQRNGEIPQQLHGCRKDESAGMRFPLFQINMNEKKHKKMLNLHAFPTNTTKTMTYPMNFQAKYGRQ